MNQMTPSQEKLYTAVGTAIALGAIIYEWIMTGTFL